MCIRDSYVDGKYKGVSPVRNLRFPRDRERIAVVFEHPVLGSEAHWITVKHGTDLQFRW